MKIGCILMAAGAAARFGANKLLAELGGKPLYEWAMDALPAERFAKTAVVTGYTEIAAAAQSRGFAVVKNDRPEDGLARTIRLGLMEMGGMDACLFCVADQPMLRRASVERLVAGYAGGVAALAFEGKRGNPVIFPKALFGELCALGPNETGAAVIARHEDLLRLVPAEDANELFDVDTREGLFQVTGNK